MSDADAEGTETQVWLDISLDCGYIKKDVHTRLTDEYKEVGRMLGNMISHPEKFLPR